MSVKVRYIGVDIYYYKTSRVSQIIILNKHVGALDVYFFFFLKTN